MDGQWLTVSTSEELLKNQAYLVGLGWASTGQTMGALRPRPIPCTTRMRFAHVGLTASRK